jgi:hydrogenase-4 component B
MTAADAAGWLALAAAIAWAVAAIAALGARRMPVIRAATGLSSVGGAAAMASGILMLSAGRTVARSLGAGETVGTLEVRVSPLAGVFVALLGLIALASGLYAPRYHLPHAADASRGTRIYLCVYSLTLVASLAVLTAGNVSTFLVAWETMALLCYLLVLRHARKDEAASGALWFLALSEVGFGCLVAAFAILAAKTGSTDFTVIAARAPAMSPGWRDAVFLLALTGFGFKAGLVPLHVWLPRAHPVAPADGSALLSGLVVKLGVYGIALTAFNLLGTGPAWWGVLTMALGAISALLGILYALAERDIKRFLAYSTIENIGVILTAIGAGMTFASYHQPQLSAFLLLAALYHVANHGTYKTLLFFEAGVTEHATGTRDMDRLGGLATRLPRSGVIGFIGTLGIAALPPLNGFVSEWLIFQGLFQGFRIPSHLVGILIVVAGATLGLTAGLAINAFVRAFGIPYLGMPRTRAAAEATEHHQPLAGPGVLAAVCVALGIGAPLVLIPLATATRAITGTALRSVLLPGKLTVIPAHTDFSAFSPTYLTMFLIAVCAVPILIHLAGRRTRPPARTVPVWDGGIVAFKPRMQYSAMTFAAPVRVTFDRMLYRTQVQVQRASDDPAGRSGPVHYDAEISPIFERLLYRPVIRAVQALADFVRPIQSGDVNLYLLYVFLALLACYLLGAL